jgi:hypothetical protein
MIQTQRKFDLNRRSGLLANRRNEDGSLFSVAAELAAVISEADPGADPTIQEFQISNWDGLSDL